MTANLTELDAHVQPSKRMREEWKAFSRLSDSQLLQDSRISDPRLPLEETEFCTAGSISGAQAATAYKLFGEEFEGLVCEDAPILYHPLLPGLLIVPALVPPAVQIALLDRMIHRDLSNPKHQTNLHLHYHLPYPSGGTVEDQSFFALSPDAAAATFTPKDPSVHKPLSASQVLQRRLHWLTLGGQYDWTNRVYPGEEPPPFPPDIEGLLGGLFPDTQAQAAIVNFYSPGDTMAMHRDVSEETDRGLVSVSLGCEGLFMIAPSVGDATEGLGGDVDERYLLLRLRSGDVVYMTKESRSAWHGVPKVLAGTCPDYLEAWPAVGGKFEEWRGWMKNKRINLNVRQMRD